ncbi:putative elongator complex protein 2 [Halotydeus destructor]|nr:putative elongator complex protein 2 [Halotydeus destructor]
MTFADELDNVYVSAACNRYPHSLDYGHSLIAYGSCNAVAIYDTQAVKVVDLLHHHTGLINCVRWIIPDQLLIASSADQGATIWERNANKFTLKFILSGEGPVVNSHTVKRLGSSELVTVTLTSEFCLNVFVNDIKIASKKLTNYAFDVKIIQHASFLPPNYCLIAYASGDECVHLDLLNLNTNVIDELILLSGHEDWVRAIDVQFSSDQVMTIASGAQDNFIRIWKIERAADDAKTEINERMFNINDGQLRRFRVRLETVLAGHEGWVYSVKWLNIPNEPLRLLSCSIDKTLVLWEEPSEDIDDIWLEKTRVGEVGGNNIGFLGCSFKKVNNLSSFVGHSFNGAVHVWNYNKEAEQWTPGTGFGGHFGPVVDLAWSPDGEYLLSTSHDETTRLHAPWSRDTMSGQIVTWHEIARPQVHGYEINCISTISGISFVTGADEKVIRLFKATQSFLDSWKNLTKTALSASKDGGDIDLPKGAAVPALGLSNRAIFSEEKFEDATVLRPVTLTEPPTEENLMQNTLWPEVQKLYGHGYELYALASNSDGSVLASSCKATKAEHASLILWKKEQNYTQYQTLPGHQLTVTSIKFSPNDQFIVSVSRDRTWTLHEKSSDSLNYSRVASSDKKNGIHSRIIWDVAWSPDSTKFLTVSRDGKVVLWTIDRMLATSHEPKESTNFVVPTDNSQLDLGDCILSCDIADSSSHDDLVAAFGLENGSVVIAKWSHSQSKWTKLNFINDKLHHLPIRKLRWHPNSLNFGHQIATCSDDRIVRIVGVNI